jgi:hypothetical protein
VANKSWPCDCSLHMLLLTFVAMLVAMQSRYKSSEGKQQGITSSWPDLGMS